MSARLPDSPALIEQTKVYLHNEILAVWFSLHQAEVVYLEHHAECLKQKFT